MEQTLVRLYDIALTSQTIQVSCLYSQDLKTIIIYIQWATLASQFIIIIIHNFENLII